MKLSRKSLFLAGCGLVVACVLALAASALLLPRGYATIQTVEKSFTIDTDFSMVRKILVRTDALKRIITMTGESEFVDQKWTAVGGGLESFNPLDLAWNLELRGTLRVRTLDPYVGRDEVVLAQEVKIDPNQVHSDIALTQGSERLLDYEMTVWFFREVESGQTRVQQRLKQEILTDAPWFAHWVADRRVRASAERALANQEQAIRSVIEDNRKARSLLLRAGAAARRRLALDDFNANAAGPKQLVHPREPQLLLPRQSQRVARAAQLLAIVRPAAPYAAGPRARKVVFGRHQQHPPAGPHHARQLSQTGARLGQVLQHVAAGDAIERFVGKGQVRQIGRHVGGPGIFQPVASPPQHFGRQIAAGDPRRRVGVFEQVPGDLARPAADVENVAGTPQIEAPLAQHPVAQGNVQRQQAGGGQQRALRPPVNIAHLFAILLVADPSDQVVFQEPENCFSAARDTRLLLGAG
jgi:hypothetical protein